MYGFKRIVRGDDIGAYIHPAFKRDRQDLLSLVRRISVGSNKNLEELGAVLTNVRSKRKLDPYSILSEESNANSKHRLQVQSGGVLTRCRKSQSEFMVQSFNSSSSFDETLDDSNFCSSIDSMSPSTLMNNKKQHCFSDEFDFDRMNDEDPGCSSVSSMFNDDYSTFTSLTDGYRTYCNLDESNRGSLFIHSCEKEESLLHAGIDDEYMPVIFDLPVSPVRMKAHCGSSPKHFSPKSAQFFPARVYMDALVHDASTSGPAVFPKTFPPMDLTESLDFSRDSVRPVGLSNNIFGKGVHAAHSSADMSSGSTAHETSTLYSSQSFYCAVGTTFYTPRSYAPSHIREYPAVEVLDDTFLMEVLLDLD